MRLDHVHSLQSLLLQRSASSSHADLCNVMRCSSLNEVSRRADFTTLHHSGQSSLSAIVKFGWCTCLRKISYGMMLVPLVEYRLY
ncbi:hypothetical protein EON65_49735 [archaeon]|nr:MAG: hypothetical protein EON65_49735 [archaeon]